MSESASIPIRASILVGVCNQSQIALAPEFANALTQMGEQSINATRRTHPVPMSQIRTWSVRLANRDPAKLEIRGGDEFLQALRLLKVETRWFFFDLDGWHYTGVLDSNNAELLAGHLVRKPGGGGG